MGFRVVQKTLERLDWTQIVARLSDHCRTPQAHARLLPESEGGTLVALFEDGMLGVRERLAETSEARALLAEERFPPLGGLVDLEGAFQRAAKGGALTPHQLLDVGAALSALRATSGFLRREAENAPRLAALGEGIESQPELAAAIDECIDSAGEVRDRASPALRDARGDTSRLSGELQRRLARYLQNPDVAGALSDDYYTVRNDRYVLPVRADARNKVRGIVHDASGSGTTLFIEPEGVVELNNQLKQAELTAVREVRRVLLDLSARVAIQEDALRAGLDTLADVDLAFARGHLSIEMDAVEPRVEREGVFDLPQLRHPLIASDQAVPNDLRLGEDFTVMVISGPNGGGKTVAMKAVALAALCVRAGLHVAAAPGARVDLVDAILADIGDDQDIRESLSTFSAHMANVARIVGQAGEHTLVVLDEVGVGTDPGEGAALAQSVLETLAESGARVIATTHYNLLKEMAAVDLRFRNASVEFDPDTLAPTYRLHMGEPGVSSATAVAARMGMPSTVLERANALLEREDRRLDRMLSELATSRAALEREQRETIALRAESEATRNEYRAKLQRLQERRDKLFHEMRDGLDRAFSDAHEQVATVIRELQRGGSAQDAARARARLQSLAQKAREAEVETGVKPRDEERHDAVDWPRARPGDPVRVPGGRTGTLETLPDRRGRVAVKVGGARLVVSADRVGAVAPADSAPERSAAQGPSSSPSGRAPLGGGQLRCDLRGQRVEEALELLAEALDRASRESRDDVLFIHGYGTGALRKAVRDELQRSPYVADARPGESEQGGDGVTIATLRS